MTNLAVRVRTNRAAVLASAVVACLIAGRCETGVGAGLRPRALESHRYLSTEHVAERQPVHGRRSGDALASRPRPAALAQPDPAASRRAPRVRHRTAWTDDHDGVHQRRSRDVRSQRPGAGGAGGQRPLDAYGRQPRRRSTGDQFHRRSRVRLPAHGGAVQQRTQPAGDAKRHSCWPEPAGGVAERLRPRLDRRTSRHVLDRRRRFPGRQRPPRAAAQRRRPCGGRRGDRRAGRHRNRGHARQPAEHAGSAARRTRSR